MTVRAIGYGLLFSLPLWAIGYVITVAISRHL